MIEVANYGDLCGECPVWDEGTGTLYWVDAVGRRFYCYNAETGQHQILKNEIEINGFRLNLGGGFVLTNSSGIWLWDAADRLTLVSDHVDGVKCQMNDCATDSRGRLYSGTTYFDPATEYKLGYLLRIDNDGKASILDEGFHLSNGLAFSPEDRTIYFTDSIARRIYAYDYDVATGNIRHRRVLVDVPRTEGIPDGLAVDGQGFLWSAQWYGSAIVRYDPDGKVERRISTPAKQTSCCAFGVRVSTPCISRLLHARKSRRKCRSATTPKSDISGVRSTVRVSRFKVGRNPKPISHSRVIRHKCQREPRWILDL
ncbi:MAG: SMP-30/gluconolactonase/LRE family protein [Bryobacteraceae bacterium]